MKVVVKGENMVDLFLMIHHRKIAYLSDGNSFQITSVKDCSIATIETIIFEDCASEKIDPASAATGL